jgi:hypothetical protein
MAIRIGRLRAVGFAKRGTPPTTPVNAGTFISPTQFIRFMPPHAWFPAIQLLESPAISGQRELPQKAVKGPGTIGGLKTNQELEPTDVFGHQLTAAFGQDTVTGDGIASAHAHNFECLDSAQLPTYDFWHDEGDKQWGFAAMMAHKWDLILEKAAIARQEMEWTGLYHVDALALAPVISIPAPRPLPFAVVDVTLGGALVTNLSSAHLTVENAVEADHTLRSDTNFPSRIWTTHQQVGATWEQFFEDATEYNKFLNAASPSAATPTSLLVTLTSPETFVEGALPATAFKYSFMMGSLYYLTAEVQLPAGVIKMTATARALQSSGTIGAGGNAYAYTNRSLVGQFINGVAAAY